MQERARGDHIDRIVYTVTDDGYFGQLTLFSKCKTYPIFHGNDESGEKKEITAAECLMTQINITHEVGFSFGC